MGIDSCFSMETRGSALAFALRSMQTHATNILARGFYLLNRTILYIFLWGIFYFSFFYFWTRRLHFLWHNGNNEVRKRRHFFPWSVFVLVFSEFVYGSLTSSAAF